MSAAGLFWITRPANAVMAGIAVVVAYFIATGTLLFATIIPFLVVALITAAGNVINDYFDADIDAVNRADRPIPSGRVSRNAALWYAIVLFLSGIAFCLFTNWICIAIAVFNSFLLALYAARLKSMPLVGNIAVSFLSGSMFLFGGAFAGMDGLIHLVPIAAMTFLAMMARELIKDAEDVEGDKAGGAVTLPIHIGVKKTSLVAFVFVVLSALASAVPVLWWGIPYLVLIGLVDLILLAAAKKALSCETPACVRQSKASAVLKYGMFASLLVFVVSALFFG